MRYTFSHMLRRMPAVLSLLLALLVPGGICAAQPDSYWDCLPLSSDLRYENLPFAVGEHVKYNINYKWGVINGNVCKADMRLEAQTYNGIPALGARIYGQTNSFYDTFFKVREDLRATLTRDGLVPLYAYREAKEGGYTMSNESIWNYETTNPTIFNAKTTSKKGRRESTVEAKHCITDILSVFYLLRCMDFEEITRRGKFTMGYTMDGKLLSVEAQVIGREMYTVKGIGKVPAIKVGAVLTQKGDYGYAYFSAEPGHMLLGFAVPVVVGNITATISDWKGLKYPLAPAKKAGGK